MSITTLRETFARFLLWLYGYRPDQHHFSDCSLHNMPAYLPRPCDCRWADGSARPRNGGRQVR